MGRLLVERREKRKERVGFVGGGGIMSRVQLRADPLQLIQIE